MVTVDVRNLGVRLAERVYPRASRTELAGLQQGALHVRLRDPPVAGAASEAFVDVVADSLGVVQRMIRIESGASSRSNVVHVKGANASAVTYLNRTGARR